MQCVDLTPIAFVRNVKNFIDKGVFMGRKNYRVLKIFIGTLLILFVCGCAVLLMDVEKELEKYEQIVATERQEYVDAHPELDQRTKEAILNGKIFIGMNKEQTIASWGKPLEVNRSVGSWGVHEQWIYCHTAAEWKWLEAMKNPYRYDCSSRHSRYLYFEDGKLKSWQD